MIFMLIIENITTFMRKLTINWQERAKKKFSDEVILPLPPPEQSHPGPYIFEEMIGCFQKIIVFIHFTRKYYIIRV